MLKIQPDIEIEDLVREHPEAVKILTQRGIICIQCGAPVWGTLEETIIRAGQNVEEIVTEINSALNMKIRIK